MLPALSAGFSGLDSAGRNAIVPNLVRRSEVSTANAIFQALFQFGLVAGPALAGLLLAGAGVRFVYWLDVAGFGVALFAVFLISPQPVREPGHRPGLRSVMEGLRYVRGKQAIEGAYLIDINAMVFGMPRALFPALAVMRFGGGAATLGFLYAAPGAGALLGALTTGWVSRIQRQGLAVIVAVIGWGVAITCFGLVSWLPLALVLLAAAGFADVISAVFRSTIIQLAVPDALRGRLAGLQIAVVTGGPRVGDLEAGAVATGFGNTVSVVSGGLACIAGALLLARALPGFRRQRMDPVSARPRASAASDEVCPRGCAPHAPGVPQDSDSRTRPPRPPGLTTTMLLCRGQDHDDSHRGGCAGQRPVTGEAGAAGTPAGDSTASAGGQGSGQPPRHAAEGPAPTYAPWHGAKPRPLLAWAMGLGFFTLSS